MQYRYIGELHYNAHSATPIVVGDFAIMAAWKGAPDGDAEGFLRLESGNVFGYCAGDLASPHVYVGGSQEVIMLVKEGSYGRSAEPPAADELKSLIEHDFDEAWEDEELEILSGGLVMTIAYNATPAAGADTSALDELCYHEDVPPMPAQVPGEVLYLEELAVIPLEPGSYSVQTGRVGDYERCTIARIDR